MHNIKCLKTYIRQIYLLKHDNITLKIRFIAPLHDKTSDLDFASNEDPDQPEHPPILISLHSPHEERYERSDLLPIERTARTLIRPVWSASSMGA